MTELQKCNYCGKVSSKEDLIEVDKEDLTTEGDWECLNCGVTDDFAEVE